MNDDTTKQGGRFVGLPLWDEVKKTIYDYWTEGNYYLSRIDNTRVNEEYKAYGTDETIFKATVLKLYRACKHKFVYHKSDAEVQKLMALKLVKHTDLSLGKAEELFDLLGYFIEVDGITRFEKSMGDKSHMLVDGLE